MSYRDTLWDSAFLNRRLLCAVYMAEINRIEVQKFIDKMSDSVHMVILLFVRDSFAKAFAVRFSYLQAYSSRQKRELRAR